MLKIYHIKKGKLNICFILSIVEFNLMNIHVCYLIKNVKTHYLVYHNLSFDYDKFITFNYN